LARLETLISSLPRDALVHSAVMLQ